MLDKGGMGELCLNFGRSSSRWPQSRISRQQETKSARQAQACLARVYPFPHDRTAANCDVCNRAKGSVLQIIEEELRHALIEMQARVAAIDKVIAVCIDLHLKLLVGLYQSFRIFRAIAVVYIVVGRTVNEQ